MKYFNFKSNYSLPFAKKVEPKWPQNCACYSPKATQAKLLNSSRSDQDSNKVIYARSFCFGSLNAMLIKRVKTGVSFDASRKLTKNFWFSEKNFKLFDEPSEEFLKFRKFVGNF